MPIDLKWIRNCPKQVEEWQKARYCGDWDSESTIATTTQRVQDLDVKARRLLQEGTQLRKAVKQVSLALRPNAEPSDKTREELVEEKKRLQSELQQLEQDDSETRRNLQQQLASLASPIDEQIVKEYPLLLSQTATGDDKLLPSSWDWSSPTAWNFIQGIASYAYHQFGARYKNLHLAPSKSRIDAFQTHHADFCHAMWGVLTNGENSTFSTENKNLEFPAWLLWVQESIPRKSMFGAKQLPLFSLLRGSQEVSFITLSKSESSSRKSKKKPSTSVAAISSALIEMPTLELLAMTSATMWDARTMQTELIQELLEFYKSLFPLNETEIKAHSVTAPELSPHEVSRVELSLTHQQHGRVVLGSVSNFGDSSSRALELSFKGGGSHESKDFVHWVRASILSPSTFEALVAGNVIADTNKLAIASCLEPHLIPDGSWKSSPRSATNYGSLELSTQPVSTLTSLTEIAQTSGSASQGSQKKLVLLEPQSIPRGMLQKQVQAEAAACPFDFLLSQ